MKDVKEGLSVKNMSDLVLKEIYGVYKKKNLTKEEIKCYKMTDREFFRTYYDYDEDYLNTKSNKNVFVKILSGQILLKLVKVKKKEV